MKRIITVYAALLIAASVYAQAPEGMSYQAVVRDDNGELISNQTVSMLISISKDSACQTVVYEELQRPSTNENGLLSIEIGAGAYLSGDFTTIDWATGPYYLKSEIDPTGGSDYSIMGMSKLQSVPYALYATIADQVRNVTEIDPLYNQSTASGITENDTSNWNNKQDKLAAGSNIQIEGNTISATIPSNNELCLGQDTLGGIIFYLYKDAEGNQHGVVVSKTGGMGPYQSTPSIIGATNCCNGGANTERLLMYPGPISDFINDLNTNTGYDGWRMPSGEELLILMAQRTLVNRALIDRGLVPIPASNLWSSSEVDTYYALVFNILFGRLEIADKTKSYPFRGIRSW